MKEDKNWWGVKEINDYYDLALHLHAIKYGIDRFLLILKHARRERILTQVARYAYLMNCGILFACLSAWFIIMIIKAIKEF
jgi:CO dehydrogenase/acetyl-CoA synthase epsilon subunit